MARSHAAVALALLLCTTACYHVKKSLPGFSPLPSRGASTISDPVIAAAGDIACEPGASDFNGGKGTGAGCRERDTAALLAKGGYTAILTLGDDQYDAGSLSDYRSVYGQTWGRFNDITYPVPGNHEYGTARAAGYYAYFGARAGDPTRGYYSFDIGAWHMIALNSNCGAIGGCGDGSPQVRWLREDLAAHRSECTLAYWHHPRFSSGIHGNNDTYDAFWRVLYGDGADVVLVGHDHNYERFAPQTPDARSDAGRGIREFVVGTGGRSVYPFLFARANSEVRHSGTFGILALTLHPSGYDWRFVPVAGSSFTDSGSGSCH